MCIFHRIFVFRLTVITWQQLILILLPVIIAIFVLGFVCAYKKEVLKRKFSTCISHLVNNTDADNPLNANCNTYVTMEGTQENIYELVGESTLHVCEASVKTQPSTGIEILSSNRTGQNNLSVLSDYIMPAKSMSCGFLPNRFDIKDLFESKIVSEYETLHPDDKFLSYSSLASRTLERTEIGEGEDKQSHFHAYQQLGKYQSRNVSDSNKRHSV